VLFPNIVRPACFACLAVENLHYR